MAWTVVPRASVTTEPGGSALLGVDVVNSGEPSKTVTVLAHADPVVSGVWITALTPACEVAPGDSGAFWFDVRPPSDAPTGTHLVRFVLHADEGGSAGAVLGASEGPVAVVVEEPSPWKLGALTPTIAIDYGEIGEVRYELSGPAGRRFRLDVDLVPQASAENASSAADGRFPMAAALPTDSLPLPQLGIFTFPVRVQIGDTAQLFSVVAIDPDTEELLVTSDVVEVRYAKGREHSRSGGG